MEENAIQCIEGLELLAGSRHDAGKHLHRDSSMTPSKTEPLPAAGKQDAAAPRPFAAAADDELVARILRCDRAAFAELVRRYHGSLLRVALVFVRDKDVAEEVVQDTWLGVLDGLGGFDGRASFRTWIFRILTNRAKTRGERESRCVPFSALGCGADDKDTGLDPARFDTRAMWKDAPHPWAAQTAEELLRFGEARKVMEDTMSTLSEAQRAVITLRDLEGVSPEETCSLLEITMANQRVLLHRARARVRGALERHFRGVRSC